MKLINGDKLEKHLDYLIERDNQFAKMCDGDDDYSRQRKYCFEADALAYGLCKNVMDYYLVKDVQPVVDTENMAIVSDEFICKKCGIYLKDYIKVVMDEDNDGYIDEQHYDYEPKFCPECGAKVKSCIKIPKRDKPLYTMDEICKMNGVEFKIKEGGQNENN